MKGALYLPAGLLLAGAFTLGALTQDGQEPGRTLADGRVWHLGDDATPEWPEAPEQPDAATELVLPFQAAADPQERTLELQARHVDNTWQVSLNGVSLGALARGAERHLQRLPIPGGTLRDGSNELRIAIDRVGDDITVGPLRLLDRGYREIHRVVPLEVLVRDAATGEGMPARLTVLDAEGGYASLYYPGLHATPVRDGFTYTSNDGTATLELSAGEYTVYASRGTEWSVASNVIVLPPDGATRAALDLRHEVDTPGYASMDTHLHTLTHSGHGDASVEERVLSVAGEGIDVAIATDHNHNTDYRPQQRSLGLEGRFLAVTGNEVSTPIGHFNAFPLSPDDAIPMHDSRDWMALSRDMRDKGAQVVILNHPRWPDVDRGPFGVSGLDPATGIFADGLVLPVDAIEVFNSTVVEHHWRVVLEDWFGLLNHGVLVRGVGSSDSHTVIDPPGQGRTYVRTPAERPGPEHVDALCRSLRFGDATISKGLYLEVTIGDQPPGSLVAAPDRNLDVMVRVACASWASAETVEVWVNGTLAARIDDLPTTVGEPTDLALPISINPLPLDDCWVVVVAEGPKPDAPWRYTLQDGLAAVSNPIFIDRDLDGRWASPFLTAEHLLEEYVGDPDGLQQALQSADAAVRAQVEVLLRTNTPRIPEEDGR